LTYAPGSLKLLFSKLGARPLTIELVPKLIDYALKRMVLEQALAVFQAKALQN
jgi:hypothetical protein